MQIKRRNVRSVSDLVKRLLEDIHIANEPVWFRGHADEKWTLLPAYQRLETPPPESTLINKFKQSANYLVTQAPDRNDKFGWLFLMQHYSCPTRLLDWTESALAGLFFAVREKADLDGALWMLFPLRLNRNAT